VAKIKRKTTLAQKLAKGGTKPTSKYQEKFPPPVEAKVWSKKKLKELTNGQ
jgi:hypothetical protein